MGITSAAFQVKSSYIAIGGQLASVPWCQALISDL
jgi:hypothetical protein